MNQSASENIADDNWLRIGRIDNAIDNLHMTVYFLKTFSDSKKWKWAIIALYQTLYSFFIVALVNCGQKVTKGKYLLSVIDAAKLLGDPENLSAWDNARPLTMAGEQASAFVALVRMLRNNFEHFHTDHWSIEIKMVEDIFRKLTPVIRFITLESNIVWFTEEQELTVKRLISQLEALISMPNGSMSI